jgi:flotillin
VADVHAYTRIKQADAERQAADLQYQAKLRLAEGDAQSSIKRAEGDKAIKMVDVTVEREKVNVDQARVEVERQNLANKQEFGEAALKFEIEKLRIDAERDVRIQTAQSMGSMLSKVNMQIFGDPETMAKMTDRFMRVASYGTALEGLASHIKPETRDLLAKLGSGIAASLAPGNGDGIKHGDPANQPAVPDINSRR